MRAAGRPPFAGLAAAALCAVLGLASCGGSNDGNAAEFGTAFLHNETDQGMAPLVVTEFFLFPAGSADPGPDRLPLDLPPGGIFAIGQFPPGLYDAVAVLPGAGNVVFMDREIRAGQPTDFVIP